jgi:hypothetical protein
MINRRPYPSARNEDCLEPGAGPAQVARRAPDGRLMAHPKDMDRSKADPSLTVRSWTASSVVSGAGREMMLRRS